MNQTCYTNKARKGLEKMPRAQAGKMHEALKELAAGNTAGKDIARLQGREGYRLRRGGYRAIYRLTREGIEVLRIMPRGGIYK